GPLRAGPQGFPTCRDPPPAVYHGAPARTTRLPLPPGGRPAVRVSSSGMDEVARALNALEAGDGQAAEALLPLVYAELRRLAARQLAGEPPGRTLDATALVHEAYLRLVGPADRPRWRGRAHFFAAAAE